MAADGRPQAPHAGHHRREVHVAMSGEANAESIRGKHIRSRAGGTDEALGGNAPGIEAVTTKEMLFYESHFRSQPGGPGGSHEAGGACADHHQIITAHRLRILPIGWMHVVEQQGVVLIVRHNFRKHLPVHRLLHP